MRYLNYGDIDIDIISDRDATVASTRFDGRIYTASSKRAPGDKYDEEIGVELAVARLFGKISRTLERHANGAVKHADDVRAAKRKERLRQDALKAMIAESIQMNMHPAGRHAKPPGRNLMSSDPERSWQ